MNHRLTAIATTGAVIASFVFAPISAVMARPTSNQPNNIMLLAKSEAKLLKNVPFSNTLPDGTVVAGKVSITQFGLNEANRQLLVSGVIKGEASKNGTITEFNQAFANIPATLSSSGTKQATCDILFLDIGPINLDLLGLTVDLSQIVLDINAVSGAGNLLGNLLCALVGLLDGAGTITQILDIIIQINNLLG
ncbi:MAG TPA: hypothetical protein DDZ80_01305 [Cyanobacteria bacterium UBA8803]|nr:hypothetical protein [Cyanobacteria bacterium UBA8803]